MPKVPVSNVTSFQFLLALGALRLRQLDLARKLGKHQSTISLYKNTGYCVIPLSVAEAMDKLLDEERAKYALPAMHGLHRFEDKAASLNSHVGELGRVKRVAGVRTQRSSPIEGHLPKRRDTSPATPMREPYLVRQKYSLPVVAALRQWAQHIVAMSRDPRFQTREHQAEYRIELATIKYIIAGIPADIRNGAQGPFYLQLNELGRLCVSSAVRHAAGGQQGKGPLRSFYQHWRQHMYCGYPKPTPVLVSSPSAPASNLAPVVSNPAPMVVNDAMLDDILAPAVPVPATNITINANGVEECWDEIEDETK